MNLKPAAVVFSMRDVAQIINVPLARVSRAARDGLIAVDLQSRAVKLFFPSHLPRIAKQLLGGSKC